MTAPLSDETDGTRAVHRRRRTRWVVTGVVLIVVLGVGTGVVMTRQSARPAAAAAQGPAPATTATVSKVDLADRVTLTGKLGYGEEHTLSGHKQGTITSLPAQGGVLERGATVYQVDARPVPLFYADIPLYRDLAAGMTEGPDVKVVEENLKALGFGGFGTPDKKFTDATAAAIKKWQKALGLDQTGVLGMGDVVIAPGPVRVSTVSAELGGRGEGSLLKYTGTGRAVTVELTAAQKDMAKPGTKVGLTVTGKTTTGTVASVAPAAPSSNGNGNDNQEQKFDATITLDDPAVIGDADAGSVDARFTTAARQGVLAVPVGALLALAEGGYAVEVVEGERHRLVAVKTGLFADGKVEVSGADLAEGMKVVTTS
jgi:peptidoglycan hydrolase-like protein with peptidoglycan-binding domain